MSRPGPTLPVAMFEATVARLRERPLLYSFQTPIPADRCAELVDGIASGLCGLGVRAGDRVALLLQNDPQFVLASVAVWRLGAITVPINPMLRPRELAHHLTDAGATVLIALDELFTDGVVAALATTAVGCVLTTGALDLCAERSSEPAALPDPGGLPVHDLLTLARESAGPQPDVRIGPDDVAVLTYTSGTTGPPKGAMNTHANIAFASETYRERLEVGDGDVILGIAPLYHVTGLTAHIGLGLAAAIPTVLAHRFDAAEVARLTERHRASVTVAAITAYLALAADPAVTRTSLVSLTRAFSGGAPIPPAVVTRLHERLGVLIRPVYGLTETTGPTHICPPEESAPTHPETGALAVGRAVPGTTVRILDERGAALTPGGTGEIAVAGPQVVPGYWRLAQETAAAFDDHGLMHTGDVGVIDAQGWLYVVDRRKDMIVASGFKVWPREVEDVLYEHPAVREAAVVGVPDEYRGETVWGYVSLQPGSVVGEAELIEFCRERLAAYKYPRAVRLLDELPKTASGKIKRGELRAPCAG